MKDKKPTVLVGGGLGYGDLPEHAATTWAARFKEAAEVDRDPAIGELAPLADLLYRAVSVSRSGRETLIGALLQVWDMARADQKQTYAKDRAAELAALETRVAKAVADAVRKTFPVKLDD